MANKTLSSIARAERESASAPPEAVSIDDVRSVVREELDAFKSRTPELTHPLLVGEMPHTAGGARVGSPDVRQFDSSKRYDIAFPSALHITKDELVELRTIMNGSHFTTGRELISAVKRMATVSIAADSTLNEPVAQLLIVEDSLERHHSRMPPDTTMPEFLQLKLEEWVEMYVNGALP